MSFLIMLVPSCLSRQAPHRARYPPHIICERQVSQRPYHVHGFWINLPNICTWKAVRRWSTLLVLMYPDNATKRYVPCPLAPHPSVLFLDDVAFDSPAAAYGSQCDVGRPIVVNDALARQPLTAQLD
ncbi:MAG: hypothetical protein ACUVR8_09875 [Acidobacteriota bacterium]